MSLKVQTLGSFLILYFYILTGIRKKAMMANEIAKNLLPELHIKTHFQAATCISNNMPGNIEI